MRCSTPSLNLTKPSLSTVVLDEFSDVDLLEFVESSLRPSCTPMAWEDDEDEDEDFVDDDEELDLGDDEDEDFFEDDDELEEDEEELDDE